MKQRQSPRGANQKAPENPYIAEVRKQEDARRAAFDADVRARDAVLRGNIETEEVAQDKLDKDTTNLAGWQGFYSKVFLRGRAGEIGKKITNLAAKKLESEARVKRYEAERRQVGTEYHLEKSRRSHFAIYLNAMELAFKNLQMTPEEFEALEEKARSIIAGLKQEKPQENTPVEDAITIGETSLFFEIGGKKWRFSPEPEDTAEEEVEEEAKEKELPHPDTTEENVYALLRALVCQEFERRSLDSQRRLKEEGRALYARSLQLRGITLPDAQGSAKEGSVKGTPKEAQRTPAGVQIPITVVGKDSKGGGLDSSIAAE